MRRLAHFLPASLCRSVASLSATTARCVASKCRRCRLVLMTAPRILHHEVVGLIRRGVSSDHTHGVVICHPTMVMPSPIATP
jgi:hypothetical protein